MKRSGRDFHERNKKKQEKSFVPMFDIILYTHGSVCEMQIKILRAHPFRIVQVSLNLKFCLFNFVENKNGNENENCVEIATRRNLFLR